MPRQSAVAEAEKRRQTALLVDGNTDGRIHTAGMLRNLGYRVEASGDAFYALALLASNIPIRFMAVDMDPGAGYDAGTLVAQAMSLQPDLPIVLYSSNAEHMRGRNLPETFRILKKPFDEKDLARAVTEAVTAQAFRTAKGALRSDGLASRDTAA